MAVIKSSQAIQLNQYSSLNTNFGCRIYESTRTWAAGESNINMFQFTQSSPTTTRQTIAVSLRWAAIRTSDPKTELPALWALGRGSLNTNGTISTDSFDWQQWGGNGILWPYFSQGGASLFIGANNGGSTGVIGSCWITVCTLEWDKLTINIFG